MREMSSVILGGRTPVALARSLRRHARSSRSKVKTVAWDGVSTSCCIRRVRNWVILTIRKPSCFASPRAVNVCRSADGFPVSILLGYLITFLLSRGKSTYFLTIGGNQKLGTLIICVICWLRRRTGGSITRSSQRRFGSTDMKIRTSYQRKNTMYHKAASLVFPFNP